MKQHFNLFIFLIYTFNVWIPSVFGAEEIVIGLNYPLSGTYRVQGIQQKRAAMLAVDEINAAGGILGRFVQLVQWDSQSNAEITSRNVVHMIEKDKAIMILGSISDADALAAGAVCQAKGVPFFSTLAYADEITGIEAHRYVFRESYNMGMATRALLGYLNSKLPASINRYFYITTQEAWGKNIEAKLREGLNIKDQTIHKGVYVPFPIDYKVLWNALQIAQQEKPDVLMLVLFGDELITALKLAVTTTKLKSDVQIVVPSITQGIAKSAGEAAMEGVISTIHWSWEIPYQYNYSRGKAFVENFYTRYGTTPSTSAASAYTSIYEYKAAVERANSFNGSAVVTALEGYEYQLLKDEQKWQNFDHQSVQTVYLVRGRFNYQTIGSYEEQGFFEIIDSIPGDKLILTREDWNAARLAVGKSVELEISSTVTDDSGK